MILFVQQTKHRFKIIGAKQNGQVIAVQETLLFDSIKDLRKHYCYRDKIRIIGKKEFDKNFLKIT